MQALFVVSPYAMPDDMLMKRFNYLAPIIESYGYDYINMNALGDEVDLDFGTDFYDGGAHVNALGAAKCTKYLGDYISTHYDFTDKREQEEYASWDDAYELWLEEYDEFANDWENRIEKDFTK